LASALFAAGVVPGLSLCRFRPLRLRLRAALSARVSRAPCRCASACRPKPVAVVAFSGGRRLPVAFRPLVSRVAAAVAAAGRGVAVGCAGGADGFVRAAVPGAQVFRVSPPLVPAAFAARSVALVRAAAAGGPGSGLVAFPSAECPAGLAPDPAPGACFCGLGSGSWASAAFAAGLGLPLVVFPCGFSRLPPWGLWRPLSGAWLGGFLLVR